MDISGAVVFTKCISIACGGSMPLAFADYARIAATTDSDNIVGICRVLRGRGKVSGRDGAFSVQGGGILLLDSGGAYTFTAQENLLANLIVFDRRLFSSSYAYQLGREALLPFHIMMRECRLLTEQDTHYEEIVTTLEIIWQEAALGETASPIMAVAMLWRLAAQLQRQLAESGSQAHSVRQTRNLERLDPAVQYMYRCYDTKITLQDMAKAANMSVPNFSSVFRETMGIPPMEYLNRLRLHNAVDLLQNTDKKITNIAEECGFFSISNFIKAFHNSVGISPSQYRKESGAANKSLAAEEQL